LRIAQQLFGIERDVIFCRFVAIIILLGFHYVATAQQAPHWVQSRPMDPSSYIGIGVASKSNPNYAQEARDQALTDIAHQISVSISSENSLQEREDNEVYSRQFTSTTRSETSLDLEFYEVIDTFNGEDEYHVFLKLNKEQYAKSLQASKAENALIVDCYQNEVSLIATLKSKFQGVPSDGARYVYMGECHYLVGIGTASIGSKSNSELARICQVKAQRAVSLLINGSEITSETIISTSETITDDMVSFSESFRDEINDRSTGFVHGMQKLTSFSSDDGLTFVFVIFNVLESR
jgi:hypothetical protein